MGVIDWGRVGGSREEKGVSRKERDGFVSHIIDWSPCWAYCGDQFPRMSWRNLHSRACTV